MATTVSMTNILANGGKGWFPATRGNCSWQLSSITPGDGAASSIKIIPAGAGEVTLTSASHALVASHKYYVTFKIRFESAVTGTCDWYWPVAEPAAASGMAVKAAAGAWTRLSAAFDRTSFSDGSYPCRFDYNNNDGSNRTFWFTSCLLVDLTAAFGAGKEPSKDWLTSMSLHFRTHRRYSTSKIWGNFLPASPMQSARKAARRARSWPAILQTASGHCEEVMV